jgi:hypothetical protein
MVDAANLAYSYKGNIEALVLGVKKSCEKMSLVLKDEAIAPEGFTIVAAQRTNWLSTNWPMKFHITAEKIGETFALIVNGGSSMGSITQSRNNSARSQELLSLIKVYAPSN